MYQTRAGIRREVGSRHRWVHEIERCGKKSCSAGKKIVIRRKRRANIFHSSSMCSFFVTSVFVLRCDHRNTKEANKG